MAYPEPKPETPPDPEEAAFLAAVEEGIAAADAGDVLPYEELRRWLLSWGTENELPPPGGPDSN